MEHQDRFPESHVESIDIRERTLDIQSGIAERLGDGENLSTIINQLEERELMEVGEDLGTVYPEIVREIGGNVLEPDNSHVQDVESSQGEPDMIISQQRLRLCLWFYGYCRRVDPDYVELYTIHPAEQVTSEYNGRLEPDINPDVDFWWTPGGKDEMWRLYCIVKKINLV